MKQTKYEILKSRLHKLHDLRNIAISERNIYKKKQADYLINQITPRLTNLFNFSL